MSQFLPTTIKLCGTDIVASKYVKNLGFFTPKTFVKLVKLTRFVLPAITIFETYATLEHV